MLAIGRAHRTRTRLRLPDEPSRGRAPLVVKNIFAIIPCINAEGIPVRLIEQNTQFFFDIAHRGYVLATGRVLWEGRASDLLDTSGARSGLSRPRFILRTPVLAFACPCRFLYNRHTRAVP